MDIRYLLPLAILLLVGCTVTVPPPPSAWTPAAGQTAEEAYNHWQMVQATETAVVAHPTQTAVAIAEGTRVASEAAVATREAQVTQDYHQIAIERERIGLQMTVDAATRVVERENAEATRVAGIEAARLQQEADNHTAVLRAAQERAHREERRQMFKDGVTALILALVATVAVWLGLMYGYQLYTQAQNSKQVQPLMYNPAVAAYITHDTRGNPTIYTPKRTVSASNGDQSEQRLLAAPAAIRVPDKAPWDRLIAYDDPVKLALGVNTETGYPVLVDRTRTPHLLAAGTTGAGKTTGILIPYVVGAYGAGDHIVVFNGKGADFNFAQGWLNWTAVGTNRDELDNVAPLVDFLKALRNEAGRRGRVLAQYNARNWASLPATAGEGGQIVVAIDEFITMIRAAEIQMTLAKAGDDRETASHYEQLVIQLWSDAFYLISQGRKYGIFLVATLTDPTNDALGKIGSEVKRQCARVAVSMQAAASSRSFLESGEDSCDLPYGRFLYNLGGQSGEAVAFHPSPHDLRHYRQVREERIKPNPLPQLVAEAVEVAPGEYVIGNGGNGATQPLFVAPEVNQAAADGRLLDGVIDELNSLSAVARTLYGREDTSGQDIEQRVVPALRWRIAELGCGRSGEILGRSKKYG